MTFSKLKKAMLIKSLLLPSLLLLPALALADTPNQPEIARFSLFCINNITEHNLNYQIKWGDGDGVNWTVAASSRNWHAWQYAVPGSIDSPTPYIIFDSDLTDGESWVTYRLEPFAAADVNCQLGKNYQFEWELGSTRYIDLRYL
jgi:hypothetical protein